MALDAQRIAAESSKKADNISVEPQSTMEQTIALSASAQSLASKLDETCENVQNKKELAAEDSNAARQVWHCFIIVTRRCPVTN
jgi:hypothetical protein